MYEVAEGALSPAAELLHNIALCHFGLGRLERARAYCNAALNAGIRLWQSEILFAKILRAVGEPMSAEQQFRHVLRAHPDNAEARLGMADLSLNEFGDPLAAIDWVQPLIGHPECRRDATLTYLMASLYDREIDAWALSAQIMNFSARELVLPVDFRASHVPLKVRPGRRLRVGLLSPLFSASPVYFLCIAFFRRIAASCDLIVFNRGSRHDWATDAFRAIAHGWHDVSHLGAQGLAEAIHGEAVDELYDLGGWMDPVGLQALSAKPAPRQYKWVGGQSATTGLKTFDGWIGDDWQSPLCFQGLYSEPLVNVGKDYAEFTPPPYLPKPASRKSASLAIFANPAKLSRSFLAMLAGIPGRKCFIHRQFRHSCVRDRIEDVLGRRHVEFIFPESHREALAALNGFATMIDTFPYSSGVTAREAVAMGTTVRVLRVGALFCERHSARYAV